ncbi:hypothetical protein POKO110462_02660 [Pontibacter korlensis]|uniref:Transposase IS4-like domain-containing protein n=2 Tax=Pontibacter korlensis TaxID=400092 RepID=A0A0E3UXJ7_9BACT|nr:hypothetical protein [Pontibacter korlensis]AKD03636.1 hypothetical protein PKOR_11490 [Pontibacter korlensis]
MTGLPDAGRGRLHAAAAREPGPCRRIRPGRKQGQEHAREPARGGRFRSEKLLGFLSAGQPRLWVRCVKVALKSGETQFLLTSLEKLDASCLGALHHKRWGVETGTGFQKNALQLENFSA